MTDEVEPLPLSALNHLLFCERRCALIHIEGVFAENVFTLQGDLLHQRADTPGYESRPGVRIVRALPLYSHRLGLTGKADVVEFTGGGTPCPVDYKRGKRRRWDNDDVQLCAQAMCLEEMLHVETPVGAIFHAASKRRREVVFTPALRDATMRAAARLHALVRGSQIPAAVIKPQCDGCSLKAICLPELSERVEMARTAERQLFDRE